MTHQADATPDGVAPERRAPDPMLDTIMELLKANSDEQRETRAELRRHVGEEVDDIKDIRNDLGGLHDQMEQVLARLSRVSDEQHSKDHEWIQAHIERDKEFAQFWRDLGKKLAAAGIFGTFKVLWYAIVFLLLYWLYTHGWDVKLPTVE